MRANFGLVLPRLKTLSWTVIVLVTMAGFYGASFGYKVINSTTSVYSVDALAFWSVGKIADTLGYSQVYDLEHLRNVQAQVMYENQMLAQNEIKNFLPTPSPYLSVFIVSFKWLSRLNIQNFTLLWLITNLLALICYLTFFCNQLRLNPAMQKQKLLTLLLILFSQPVFDNFQEAQINVFLLICLGEFIRNATKKRPILAGVWLAGWLLKPQLLIFILPVILIWRHWKMLTGFIYSSLVILISSWVLSGTRGLEQLIALLTKYSVGMSVNATELMINWRMVGVNLNHLTNLSIGWLFTAIGMVLTLAATVYLVIQRPDFGSPDWVFIILGVLTATLAFTWHTHNHMAIILVPALMMSFTFDRISKTTITFWVLLPAVTWVAVAIIAIIVPEMQDSSGFNCLGFAFILSRFIANLTILTSVLKNSWMAQNPLKMAEI